MTSGRVDEDNNNSSEKTLLGGRKDEEGGWRKRALLAQGLVAGGVMLSAAGCGMPVGYSAVLLPQLRDRNDSMGIDDEIGSWIASVHSAATPLGSLASGVLMDRLGRRPALQVASLPLIAGWMTIALSGGHAALLAGRLVAGLAVGLTAAAGQVLVGETAEPRWRGALSCAPFASYSLGILLVYGMGWGMEWRSVAGLSLILPALATLSFFFLPESPVWLVRKGRTELAKKSLLWLRGGNAAQAKSELQLLIARSEDEVPKASWRCFLEPGVLKPFIIINVFNAGQIFSGTYLVVFYAADVLGHLGGFLTACVRFAFTVIASVLLAFVGRRCLALASGLGTALSAFLLAATLTCSSSAATSAFAVLYVAANTAGFMILPGVMLGELFPARARGLAGGATFTLFNLLLFGTAKAFPWARSAVGAGGVFWAFGGASLAATGFLYLVLPETKGATLGEIEDYFGEGGVVWVRKRDGWGTKTDAV